MPRILVLDTSTDSTEHVHVRKGLDPCDAVDVRLVFQGEAVPEPHGYDLAVHTGSALSILDDAPFHGALFGFMRAAVAAGLPQFGICYGHQALSRALAGPRSVRRCPRGVEAGWREVRFTPAGRALLGVGPAITVFQFHFDEVIALPVGARRIATNDHTAVQAFVDRHRRVVGVQFHPEFDEEAGNAIFRDSTDLLAPGWLDAVALAHGGPSGFRWADLLAGTMALGG
jgi:GMP synthase-like glutamine amidotransferase